MEANVEPVVAALETTVGTGFKAQANVVVGCGFVFDDRDRKAIVAHAVGGVEEELSVALGHHDTKVMPGARVVGEAVLDFVEGPAFWSVCREEGGGIGGVPGTDVESDDATGCLARDGANIADPVWSGGHGRALEGSAID